MKHALAHPASSAPRVRLCFVSYPHLSRLARDVIQEFGTRADIEVIEAVFDSAVDLAMARERAGAADAFISAGSNAALLRGVLRAPVATIRVDGYDLMLALMQARRHTDRVGVVTFRDTIAKLDTVKQLLNLDIAQRAYRSAAHARECFRELAAQGYQAIVGSSIVVELAEQQGLRGILAYSADSVREGIEDAIEMARSAQLEAARYAHVSSVLHSLHDAVLAVDGAQRITAANSAMQTLLGRSAAGLIGRPLPEIEPRLGLQDVLRSGLADHGTVLELPSGDWIAHRTPLIEPAGVVGAVITLVNADHIERADSSLRTRRRSRGAHRARHRFDALLGESPAFVRARDAAQRHARSEATVLIRGETGTGKELFAQAIHAASRRAARPFVALNCSAVPEGLLESELFGHEEGAFTGARRGGKPGLVELAHTGTLFLDEIGDMPPALQSRLLRVLQEREVMRVGSAAAVPVDVRIIAATHQPLEQLIEERRFRADLYHRLNILRLTVPPLRERGDDVLRLAHTLLQRAAARHEVGLDLQPLLPLLATRLLAYGWPGNVRELENVCERMAALAAAVDSLDALDQGQLAYECPELFGDGAAAASATDPARERERLEAVLAACGGNRQQAARRLGISRATLWRRLRAAGQSVAT